MTEYHFSANLLTLFAQLTPWVQVCIAIGACAVVLGVTYIIKEIVVAFMRPFYRSRSVEWSGDERSPE